MVSKLKKIERFNSLNNEQKYVYFVQVHQPNDDYDWYYYQDEYETDDDEK